MLRSMFSGLSGLKNHQVGLDVIGNNISNVNTVGYKSSRIQFTELLSQTIRGAASPVADSRGGTNPIQVGLGVGTSAIDVSHQQGNLQSTGNMSDLAIQGNGFFILSDGSNQTYTRAGAFSFDAEGTMVHSNGMKIMGWMADATGTLDSNSSIQGISIPVGQTISANQTTTITYAHNLNSQSDMDGTPKLAAGNSASAERVYGKYLGNTGAKSSPTAATGSSPITDTIGTHYITVNAETHVGTRNNLNGTETLDQLGVTAPNLAAFKVVVNNVKTGISLSNGINSSVNELISAINSQVIGVTAELSGNAVKVTRSLAGDQHEVFVEDENIFTDDGIAARVFGGGNGKWAAHAKTIGSNNTITMATTLGSIAGLNLARDLRVTIGGVTNAAVYNPTARGLNAATTIRQLRDDFNTWANVTAGYGTGANAITMGHTGIYNSSDTGTGSMMISHNSNDTDGYVAIYDDGGNDGIANMIFGTGAGTWTADGQDAAGEGSAVADTLTFGKTSSASSITHYYVEEDGGGTHYVDLSFSNGDNNIDGLDGITIIADSTNGGFKTGSMVINTVEAAEHVVSTSVYDSLGAEHTVSLTLQRTANNTWSWTASGIDTTGAGTLTFDSNGTIQSGASSGTISVGAQGGAASLSVAPNFTSVTQYADPSTMVHTQQDGYPNGALSTYSIDTNGEILGIYTNGLNQTLGKIAIAAFNNPAGLVKIEDSMFTTSNNSGEAQVGAANTAGRGSLSAGTLEMSNVDVAQEFANMIIYERGFQANSKIISTGDELLQTLVNMKR